MNMVEYASLQRIDCNRQGRDYVVGDVHGCFARLERLLQQLDFDRDRDRLFAVGDLIDRGPDSAAVVDWLQAPWFHAICGNHEAMLLDSVWVADGRLQWGDHSALWFANGGGWFFDLASAQQRTVHHAVASLPLALQVALPAGGSAALVHADVIDDSWPATCAALAAPSDAQRMQLLWSRQRAEQATALQTRQARSVDVTGVDVIFFGHTPMAAPRRSEEHTSELQSRFDLVCRLLLEKNIHYLST